MRSLYELITNEKTCTDNIEKREEEMKSIANQIAELEADPFNCSTKTHEIERLHEKLSRSTNTKEALEKDLLDIRAMIRDYLIVIMNKGASNNG